MARQMTYAPKKKPVAVKRSAPVDDGKAASTRPHEDDVRVTALALPVAKLSAEMEAYFKKCEEKLGFVPNVLKALAFEDAKLQAFVNYRQELVQNAASLSKLEIEMIATAVSAQNRCFYCITAHGNSVRQLGDPILGEMIVQNYRAARLSKRQRAMLDFAVKLTMTPWEVEEEDRERLRRAGFNNRDIWDIASVAAFYN
ncbi:MAG TPA: peroxidase-related enzyme, partial [Xanthobacteraceae bacterium]